MLPLLNGCFPSRYDPDDAATRTLAMTYDEDAQPVAHTEHNKSLFVLGMLFIKELPRIIVKENRLCFVEGNAVLFKVRERFGRAPLELDHIYIVSMIDWKSTCSLPRDKSTNKPILRRAP